MITDVAFDPSEGAFHIASRPEEGDVLEKYAGERVRVQLMPALPAPHADLQALAVLLILHPFVGRRLAINIPASEVFREACRDVLPYEVVFTSGVAPAEARAPGQRAGLAFSGGVDSTATLALMPADTEVFFLDRVSTARVLPRSLYVKDSALHACRMVADMGYSVHRVQSNLEFARRPVGFPTDWANGVPAILMADACDLASVSWGVISESAYRVGHTEYQDFPGRTIYARWDSLMRAVGLGLGAPAAGLSEVATTRIVAESRFNGVAQSCIRAPKDQPCLRCVKCFRKVLLEAAVAGKPVEGSVIDRMLDSREIARHVSAVPIHHEDVYRWIAGRLEVTAPPARVRALWQRLQEGALDTSWADYWYEPSSAVIPSEFRASAIGEIQRFTRAMTPHEQVTFEGWTTDPLGHDSGGSPSLESFQDMMTDNSWQARLRNRLRGKVRAAGRTF